MSRPVSPTASAARLGLVAALALLALTVLPSAAAQQGPPPGYTDPLVYAQDYAVNQTGQARADPVGYTSGKATPEELANETEHAAWLACWTAYEYGQDASMALDPVCSQFFTAPQTVDAPAEAANATAEITETLNGTLEDTGVQPFADEALDIVGDTVDDPTTALEQVERLIGAIAGFVGTLVGFVVAAVETVLGLLGLGGLAILEGLQGVVDGLLMLVGLPALGLQAALDGLGLGLGAFADGAVAAVDGVAAGLAALGGSLVAAVSAGADGIAAGAGALVAAVVAVVDGVAAGALAVGDGLQLGASAVGDGIAATVDSIGSAVASGASAIGDGAAAVGSAVGDAASAIGDAAGAIGDAVASLFEGDEDAGAVDGARDTVDGVETGTEADGLLDRILGLV